jgi:hypothetical protein
MVKNWRVNETLVYIEGEDEDFAICNTAALKTNTLKYDTCLKNAQTIADEHNNALALRQIQIEQAEQIIRLNQSWQAETAAQASHIAALKDALKPFAHSDLCKRLPYNGTDENAPIFIRNNAVITLADCKKAAMVLMGYPLPADK